MTLSYTIATLTLMIIKRAINSVFIITEHSNVFYIQTSNVVYFICDVIKHDVIATVFSSRSVTDLTIHFHLI